MLNTKHLTPFILRQYTRQPAIITCRAQCPRALSTSSVQHDSSVYPFSSTSGDWIERYQGSYDKTADSKHWVGILSATAHVKREKKESPEKIWKDREANVENLPKPNNAYSGRSVAVMYGDVSTALMKLRGMININAVRRAHVRDERHEKKGEKRNRLKSQRWRRRFAHEVKEKVQLVNEIRARGA